MAANQEVKIEQLCWDICRCTALLFTLQHIWALMFNNSMCVGMSSSWRADWRAQLHVGSVHAWLWGPPCLHCMRVSMTPSMCDLQCIYVCLCVCVCVCRVKHRQNVNGYLGTRVSSEFSKQSWRNVCHFFKACAHNEDTYRTHLIFFYRKHLFFWCLHFFCFIASTVSRLTCRWDRCNHIRPWCSLMMMYWGSLRHYCSQMEYWMCVSALMMRAAWKECRFLIFIPTVFLFLGGTE